MTFVGRAPFRMVQDCSHLTMLCAHQPLPTLCREARLAVCIGGDMLPMVAGSLCPDDGGSNRGLLSTRAHDIQQSTQSGKSVRLTGRTGQVVHVGFGFSTSEGMVQGICA